jgi:hypothetical protein
MEERSVNSVRALLKRMVQECGNPKRNLAYQWSCKQDLYEIKWMAEEALEQCRAFDPEADYIKRHEHFKFLEVIKGKDAPR